MNGPGASDSRTSVTYALGRDTAEAERLRRQTIELESLAAELLDRVGAAEGQSAIDVGCGPGGILELLAERVGPRAAS
jgi:trans-aconitate methyltransferase